MKPPVTKIDATGDEPLLFQQRMPDVYGDALVQADISAITVSVFDLQEQEQVFSGPVVVADSVYDTLQDWELDGGYNFQYLLASDAFYRVGGRIYRVEFKFETDTGNYYWRRDLDVEQVLTGVL